VEQSTDSANSRRAASPPLTARRNPLKPDDHSEVVPLLPIPNRTVKRLRADDSAGSRVKVGHRQAISIGPSSLQIQPAQITLRGLFASSLPARGDRLAVAS
jgi:hypothetical protein